MKKSVAQFMTQSKWWHYFKIAFLSYVCIAIFVSFYADKLIFYPPKPSTFQKSANTLALKIDSATTISAIYLPSPQAQYTVLFSHGNGEDLGLVDPFLHAYQAKGFSIFAYDYPGYGASTGAPSEGSSAAAITAAYLYLRDTLKIPTHNIIIHGRSLGCGPSIFLASEYAAGGLMLESPFISAYRLKTVIPLFPFDKYPNLSRIPQVKIPTLVMHGTQDKVIPLWHGQSIFKALTGYKQAYWVQGAGHNDIIAHDKEKYWQTISHFLKNKP